MSERWPWMDWEPGILDEEAQLQAPEDDWCEQCARRRSDTCPACGDEDR